MWRTFGVAALLLAACTRPNPRSCNDGLCTDPLFPYCDVNGTLGGERNECIAVSCPSDSFVSCEGNLEYRCNALGNNYVATSCELGCSEALAGCRLCEPNRTQCTNGSVARCDERGDLVESRKCALGCFEDLPRCRRILPSNGLSTYLDALAEPPDLVLENAYINTLTGAITVDGQVIPTHPNYLAGNGSGPSIRVFVANNVRLRNVYVSSSQQEVVTGPAVAFVAKGTITVAGRLVVEGSAGGVKDLACRGGLGILQSPNGVHGIIWASGSGGGGHATAGAAGGGANTYPGGAGGEATGNDSLEPLRGGCPAGGLVATDLNDVTTTYPLGSSGGGALQLASELSIVVDGVIDARGAHGLYEHGPGVHSVSGGGAGGGILLEAPTVNLTENARLIAKGGGGAAAAEPPDETDDGSASLGTVCPGACGDGGNGATAQAPAMAGEPYSLASGSHRTAGAGGGGLGRVRINTADATYTKSNAAIEAARVTAGLLRTR